MGRNLGALARVVLTPHERQVLAARMRGEPVRGGYSILATVTIITPLPSGWIPRMGGRRDENTGKYEGHLDIQKRFEVDAYSEQEARAKVKNMVEDEMKARHEAIQKRDTSSFTLHLLIDRVEYYPIG